MSQVQYDDRFTDAIYVVEYDHAIEYAGTRFLMARAACRGFRGIKVWMYDQYMGEVNPEGVWTFKAGQHPDSPRRVVTANESKGEIRG